MCVFGPVSGDRLRRHRDRASASGAAGGFMPWFESRHGHSWLFIVIGVNVCPPQPCIWRLGVWWQLLRIRGYTPRYAVTQHVHLTHTNVILLGRVEILTYYWRAVKTQSNTVIHCSLDGRYVFICMINYVIKTQILRKSDKYMYLDDRLCFAVHSIVFKMWGLNKLTNASVSYSYHSFKTKANYV
jgi:hypothetical protein